MNGKRIAAPFGDGGSIIWRSGRCGAETGYSGRNDGEDAELLSLLKQGWDTIPPACERTRSEPRKDDGFDGSGDGRRDSPSSCIDMVVGVVTEEQVLEEDILGRDRDRSVRVFPGLIRASVSGMDVDEK